MDKSYNYHPVYIYDASNSTNAIKFPGNPVGTPAMIPLKKTQFRKEIRRYYFWHRQRYAVRDVLFPAGFVTTGTGNIIVQ